MKSLPDGVWVNSRGETRYSSEYVKASGKPYKGKIHAHNGFEGRIGYLSWGECKLEGVTIPAPEEEPVAFVFLAAVGANHYAGLYDRIEELKPLWKEQKRKERIESLERRWKKKEALSRLEHDYYHQSELKYFDWKTVFRRKGLVELFRLSIASDNREELLQFSYLLTEKGVIRDHYEVFGQGNIEKKEGRFSFEFEVSRKLHVQKFYTRVAGVSYENRQYLLGQMQQDTELKLERDPRNQFDANAVKVMAFINEKWEHIGFLHREYAEVFAPMLDAGEYIHVHLERLLMEQYGHSDDGHWQEWCFKGAYIILVYVKEDEVIDE